jgi:uroporphyrinogen-III synthase
VRLRLGLTTTLDRATSLMPAVAALGFEGIALPCISVKTTPGGVQAFSAALQNADVLVFTSARAVAIVAQVGLPDIDVLVVGSETAAAIEKLGWPAPRVGSQGIQYLVDEARGLLEGRRVVVAGARKMVESGAVALAKLTAHVTIVELYTTTSVAPPREHVDAVVFGSPSAVDGWHLTRKLSGMLVGAVGQTTAGALRRLGIEPDVIPEFPSYMNTVERLAEVQIERSEP